MVALRILAGMALVIAADAAAAGPLDRWRPYIDEASQKFDIPALWIERVILAESGGRAELRGRPIVSRAGAMGLMQLMPGTWTEMRERLGLGADPHIPRDNILAGAFYLRLMYDRFGYPGLFGAYNAGPARYAAWRDDGKPLPRETRAYLAKVARIAFNTARTNLLTRDTPVASELFFDIGASARGNVSGSSTAGLFASLRRDEGSE